MQFETSWGFMIFHFGEYWNSTFMAENFLWRLENMFNVDCGDFSELLFIFADFDWNEVTVL